MARFPRKYSDAQRRAVVRRIVDDGCTAREAVEEAQRGELADLAPFAMPLATAKDLARRERHRRQGEPGAESSRGDDAHRRLIRLQRKELTRLEKALEAEPELGAIVGRLVAIREVAKTQRAVDALGAKPATSPKARQHHRPTASFLDDLAHGNGRG